MSPGRLWAVTCLFNPSGARSRLRNYHLFRQSLKLPLVAVELSFAGTYALKEGDADILIQLQGGSPMWQKERLLNVALRALPDMCDQVVWTDADILLPESNWARAVSDALEALPIVQPFARVLHLAPEATDLRGLVLRSNEAIMSAVRNGTPFEEVLGSTLRRANGAPCCGHVWAARRDTLMRHGLYDGCIVGGGDTAFIGAALGKAEAVVHVHHMGASQAERYRRWAQGLAEEVYGRVGYLPFDIAHLWHGTLEDRHGKERHIELARLAFDPLLDLAPHPSGAWCWARSRPDLEAFMDRYFRSRKEDGALSVGCR